MTTTTLSKEKTVPAAPLQLDLRDWFAGQALSGMVASGDWDTAGRKVQFHVARTAYALSDAMLEARTGEAA